MAAPARAGCRMSREMGDEHATVLAVTDKVDGWLTPREGVFLYEAARQVTGAGAIVEIGSWKGKSTIWLASGSKRGRGAQVYAVDHHVGSPEHGLVWSFDEFKQNIANAGVESLVTPILKTSAEAAHEWKMPIELLFIDAAHEYDAVKTDFLSWSPFLVKGATVAFHDTTFGGTLPGWPGPRQVVNEHVFRSHSYRDARVVDSITAAVHTDQNSAFERLGLRQVQLRKLLPDTVTFIYWKVRRFPRLVELGKSVVWRSRQ